MEQIGKLIVSKRGNVSAVARALKIPRNTLYKQIQADPELVQTLADERERMVDNAEDKLGAAVTKGEAWAVCFTLKTQGKDRGYTERQEVTGKNGADIGIRLIDASE